LESIAPESEAFGLVRFFWNCFRELFVFSKTTNFCTSFSTTFSQRYCKIFCFGFRNLQTIFGGSTVENWKKYAILLWFIKFTSCLNSFRKISSEFCILNAYATIKQTHFTSLLKKMKLMTYLLLGERWRQSSRRRRRRIDQRRRTTDVPWRIWNIWYWYEDNILFNFVLLNKMIFFIVEWIDEL
jgi:hypothetical protein